jgi:hypothetical protein
MTADIKDEFFVLIDSSRHKKWTIFLSHKGYRIHWLTLKTDYQPTLKTIFILVQVNIHSAILKTIFVVVQVNIHSAIPCYMYVLAS